MRLAAVQKFQQLAIENLGYLQMRHVADFWDQHQLGAWNRVRNMLGLRRKILAVPLPAQHQRLHFNVCPVVVDRIKKGDLLIDRANRSEEHTSELQSPMYLV